MAVCALALAACGHGHDSPRVASLGSSSASTAPSTAPNSASDPRQQRLAWVACLRAHGMDVPDPGPSGALPAPGDPADPLVQKAITACRQYRPSSQLNPDDPAAKQRLVRFARCMREHGVDMPDPSDGPLDLPDISSPKAKDALRACTPRATGR